MDNLLYDCCLKYFTCLSDFGYRDEEDVKKLLFYVFIQELVNSPSLSISETDFNICKNALYSICGTSCLFSYPEYCSNHKLLKGLI